mgnify:CR=1 FL=1
MRYEVKVGKEFDLADAPAKAGDSFTIEVNVDTRANEKKGMPAWKTGLIGFAIFCALVVTPPTAYGMATGDFSFLKALAGYFIDLAEAVVKAAISAIENK